MRTAAREAALGADGRTRPGKDPSLVVSVFGPGRGCRVLGLWQRLGDVQERIFILLVSS